MQIRPRAVIEQAEHGMELPAGIGLAREVQSPDEVSRDWLGPGVLDPAALCVDLIAMIANDLADEGSAHCHVALAGKAPVEERFDDAASAGVRHQGFEADDFLPDPFRLAPRTPHGTSLRWTSPIGTPSRQIARAPNQVQNDSEQQGEHSGALSLPDTG